MNKRIYTLLTLAVVMAVSTNAFASRARQAVMGSADPFGVLSDGTHGSFYYDDNYNVFANPSLANEYKNWAAIEKSNGYVSGGANQAEGGTVANIMGLSAGLYFNRGDASRVIANNGRFAINSGNMNSWDFILAGDHMVKWGLMITHGGTKPAAGVSANNTNMKLGFQYMDLAPYFTYRLSGKDSTGGTGFTYKSMGFGLTYNWGEWRPFAAYHSDKAEVGDSTLNPVVRDTIVGIGIGRNVKATEGTKFMYAVSAWRMTEGCRSTTGAAGLCVAGSAFKLPIDMSVEHDANSWMTARAGLTFNVMDKFNTTTVTTGASARLGGTFHLGKGVDLDMAVGTRTAGAVDSATAASAGQAAASTGDSFDFSSGTFSMASLTYKW